MHTLQDTIAAIATPPGLGALGVIRISGPEAIAMADRLMPGKRLLQADGYTLHFGRLTDGDEVLDEVLLSLFRGPRSYTGEDTVEISCHGSPYILQKVMEAFIRLGARPAGPGEFTLRAFMNGKLDLSQAEAVGDLIAAENEAAHRTAMDQMRGGFSGKIKELRAQLLQFAALMELELDFAEEDVEFANRDTLHHILDQVEGEVQRLASSFSLGNVLKAGVKCVIAGRPNAGKSTLLNALLQEERAIVSDIPGTTRDVIEDTLTIDGIQFRFLDTAGLRDTTDMLESMGIQRTREKIQEAQIIIYLFDVTRLTQSDLEDDLSSLPDDRPILLIGNQTDRDPSGGYLKHLHPDLTSEVTYISARRGEGIESLKKRLVSTLDLPGRRQSDPIITNLRHYNALNRITASIQSARNGLLSGLPTDLVAIDIRSALHHMGDITGEITSDEILGEIFGKFCIGK